MKSGVESVQTVDARTVALPSAPPGRAGLFLPSLAAPTAAGARTRAVVLIVAGPVQPVLLALLSLRGILAREEGRRQVTTAGSPRGLQACDADDLSEFCFVGLDELDPARARECHVLSVVTRATHTPPRHVRDESRAVGASDASRFVSRRRALGRAIPRGRAARRRAWSARRARRENAKANAVHDATSGSDDARNHDECRVYVRSLTGIGRRAALMATVGGLSLGSRREGSVAASEEDLPRDPSLLPTVDDVVAGTIESQSPATVPAREGLGVGADANAEGDPWEGSYVKPALTVPNTWTRCAPPPARG